jgi:hypothetical protein
VAFFGWYTYGSMGQSQGAAGQRWYTGQANYLPGARTLPVTLYETCCGSFNEVASTYTRSVGAATVAFHSCHAASLTFSFTGGTNAGASGTINLSRVGPTPAGCGPTPLLPITTAEGVWLRTAADDGFIHLVVLENGDTWLTYPGSGALGRGGVMHGTLTSGGGVFASELRNYDFAKDRQSAVAVTGTFEPRSTLKGSAVVEGEVLTLTRRYATDFDPPASDLIATGTWEIFYEADHATINVGATGEITGGSTSGCVFTGTLRPRTSYWKNVYDLSVTYGGAGCALGSGAATGIGLIYLSYAEPPDPYLALTILAEKNDRTAGLWWEGYKR